MGRGREEEHMHKRGMVAPRFMLSVAAWVCVLLACGLLATPAAAYKPEGEMRFALYVTISPAWFDPAQVAVAGGHALLVLLCPA